MITANFKIRFDFLVDSARLSITLEADVQEHHSETYFVVSNFHLPGKTDSTVLPPIYIRKENGRWVHTDSGKETDLSTAAGHAIDKQGA
ncbi:MAG: hypothetical protein JST68_29720 [Bacteroidetes bacterium]|nr:hypothetical protein [Bacteroidota bacterium]